MSPLTEQVNPSLLEEAHRQLGKRAIRQMEVLDPAAEHPFLCEFLDVDDSGGSQNAGRSSGVGSGNFDISRFVIAPGALEAEASSGDVLAKNQVVVRT